MNIKRVRKSMKSKLLMIHLSCLEHEYAVVSNVGIDFHTKCTNIEVDGRNKTE